MNHSFQSISLRGNEKLNQSVNRALKSVRTTNDVDSICKKLGLDTKMLFQIAMWDLDSMKVLMKLNYKNVMTDREIYEVLQSTFKTSMLQNVSTIKNNLKSLEEHYEMQID